jgi:hypothetical protein
MGAASGEIWAGGCMKRSRRKIEEQKVYPENVNQKNYERDSEEMR